VDRSLSPREGR